jgi:uncharacterized membrane protein YczE
VLPLPDRCELARRVPRCVLGLVLFGVGVALYVRAELGLGPWDVLHQGLSERTGIPMGSVAIGVGVLVLLAWIPLRQRIGLGTVLNTLLIGLTLDLVLHHLPELDAAPSRWVALAAGLVLVAIGSGLYIGSGLGPGPRDGVMMGLKERGMSVRVARTSVELAALGLGWLLGGRVGIGTLAFAFGIGPLVHLALDRFTLPTLPRPAPEPA